LRECHSGQQQKHGDQTYRGDNSAIEQFFHDGGLANVYHD
jgi:hypothetical protein